MAEPDWEEYVMDEYNMLESLEDNYREKFENAKKANSTLKKQLGEYRNIESRLKSEQTENQRLRYELEKITTDFTKLRSPRSSLDCESSSEIGNQGMTEFDAGNYGRERESNRTNSPSFEVIGTTHSPGLTGHSGGGPGDEQKSPGAGEGPQQHKVINKPLERECSPERRRQRSEFSPSGVRSEQSQEPPSEGQQVREHGTERASEGNPPEAGDLHPHHHHQKMRGFELEIIDRPTTSVSQSQQWLPEGQSQSKAGGAVTQLAAENVSSSETGVPLMRPPCVNSQAMSISAPERQNVVNSHIFVVPQALQEMTLPATATSGSNPYGIGAKPKEFKPKQAKPVENQVMPQHNVPDYLVDLKALANSDCQVNSSKDQTLNNVKANYEDSRLLYHAQQQTIPVAVEAHAGARGAREQNIPKVMTNSAAKSDANIFGTSSLASSALFGEFGVPVDPLGQNLTTLRGELKESSKNLLDLSEMNPAIVHPSDDQKQLASQVHSMASILEKNDKLPVGLSEQLFQFARDAAELEKKTNTYQAIIMRQRAQTQRCCNTDCQELRAENQRLLEQLNTLQDHQGKASASGGNQSKMSVRGETSSGPQEEMKNSEDLSKKIQNLEHINAKLFQANKDWYTKWEGLRQENQKEKDNLCARNASLVEELEQLRNDVTVLEKQLEEITTSKQQVVQRKFDLEQERLNLQRQYESVKIRLDNCTRDKRKLEAEVTTLKSTFQPGRKGTHVAEDKDLQMENSLLKQQINIFYEDFERERKDREKVVSKMEKLKKEKTDMEGHLQRGNAQKSKEIAELRSKLTELTQRRKPQPAVQHALSQPVLTLSEPVACTVESEAPIRRPNRPQGVHTHPLMTASQASAGHQVSPEHLPGAWQCRICTYINYPSRSICDICGGINQPDESVQQNASGRLELKSRGELVPGMDDVVID